MNNKSPFFLLITLALTFPGLKICAQFSLTAQLRPRAEYRNGQGAPLAEGAKAATFISQRTRLNASYNSSRLTTSFTLQDVRVWGQDISTINRYTIPENNGLMFHEAWAEVQLLDTASSETNFSFKIGRQELIYDDQRLIGNLDWLQQGRRHDALLFKVEKRKWKLHVAAAFNQNKEAQSGTTYVSTPAGYPATTNGGSMYKSMQMLHASSTALKGTASFLLVADQFSRYTTDSIDQTSIKRYSQGAWARYTTGFFYSSTLSKYNITGSAYLQFGQNHRGQKTLAHMFTLAAGRVISKQFDVTAGFDYTSGTGGNSQINKTFDPLYGTPHKFWGAMDYFYAGSGFGNAGLTDSYIRLRYKPESRIVLMADLHHFAAAGTNRSVQQHGRSYGQEIDLNAAFAFTPSITFEAGYSHFFTTSLLSSPQVKNVPDAKRGADWAYVMINIKPQLFLTK